jgi:hypothetical protein
MTWKVLSHRVPDKKLSAKRQTLGKDLDSGSDSPRRYGRLREAYLTVR